MESEIALIGAISAGLVAVIGACYAGARASLCKKVSCKSPCCTVEVERNPPGSP